MNVWIVYGEYRLPSDGFFVSGVYSSVEEANAAENLAKRISKNGFFYTEGPIVVDAAPEIEP